MGFLKGVLVAASVKILNDTAEHTVKKRKTKRDKKNLDNLERLKSLYDSGALTECEYNLEKLNILYNSGVITEREYKKRKKYLN